jgi:hypothetical protein
MAYHILGIMEISFERLRKRELKKQILGKREHLGERTTEQDKRISSSRFRFGSEGHLEVVCENY